MTVLSSQSGIKHEVRQLRTLLGRLQMDSQNSNVTVDEAFNMTVD